ncbi:MAG: hypothetical protein O2816_09830 [Planctomycetota bacterium]|nr:hypothetical protein [Planctomycetota bacterium]
MSLDLEVELAAELVGGFWGFSLPLSVLTQGRFRQTMLWESADSQQDC